MVSASPDLMSDITDIRALFPKAKLTHFKSDHIELGVVPRDGWVITDSLVAEAAAEHRRKNPPPPEVVLARKAATKRTSHIKAKL